MANQTNIVASLICGGAARRFNGTFKPLLDIHGRSLLSRLTSALATQANEIIINTNTPQAIAQERNLICVADAAAGLQEQQAGPLQGVTASLSWLIENRKETQWLVTIPGDTLKIPPDFVLKLLDSVSGCQPRYAVCNNRHHYLAALWHISQLDSLIQFLERGQRAAKHFHLQQHSTAVEFQLPEPDAVEYFFNINTEQDYRYAREHYD